VTGAEARRRSPGKAARKGRVSAPELAEVRAKLAALIGVE
jgi:hypothetical protein